MERWRFSFRLSEAVNCKNNIADMPDIAFQTTKGKQGGQSQVTGFEMVAEADDFDQAKETAAGRASRLTQLLSALSGTWYDFYLNGYAQPAGGKIDPSTGRTTNTVVSILSSRFHIRNNAILDMSDKNFSKIIKGENSKLIQKIKFMSDARLNEKAMDYAGIIKNLVLACDGYPKEKLKKFKSLRHALSHTGPLHESTINGLKKFGDGYFELMPDNGFDHDSEQNKENIKTQAIEFLKIMHRQLMAELRNLAKD